ncbi:SMI1/KNR4 family protein [Succinivibrio dextrinosolvens]|uniref:SMI1/KNR4 family protein n=1 Tax=Succinivibrio dextrinosolvens TaxID=83771 RepID=UPI00094454CB|nr:SMI1/KNR4 family protein [Succinivibrio dextrinosolvens]
MFEDYYKYIRKEDEVKSVEDIWKTGMVFFKIDNIDEEIATAEKELNISFPPELKSFYKELGYGFLRQNEDRTYNNLFFPPTEISAFYTGFDFYATDERQEYYPFDGENLIFFEVDSDVFMTIKMKGPDAGCIFYFDDKVASSIKEFIERMKTDYNYYMKM